MSTTNPNWQPLLDQWQQSGLSKRQFSKKHSLNYARFIYWSRKLAKQSLAQPHSTLTMLPIVTKTASSTKPANTTIATTPWAEFNFPNGMQLRLYKNTELTRIKDLLLQLGFTHASAQE